jgi:hypothetical protein
MITEKIKIVMSKHAMQRLAGRFRARDPVQIRQVIEQAVSRGSCSVKGDDILIEYGCLLIAGFISNGTLTITTVLNLSNHISKKFQRRLADSNLSNWNVATVLVPQSSAEVAT